MASFRVASSIAASTEAHAERETEAYEFAGSAHAGLTPSNDLNVTERSDLGISAHADLRKRCLDVVGALVLLTFFAPLMGIIYALVRLDGGPGIFAHQRVGRNGASFKCYKFRSMAPNAEQLLAELLASNEQFRKEWEAEQKLNNDPRVTRVGKFLRRKSLDELPQLLNVLKGEMSLVGPRPITADEVCRYGPYIEYYNQMVPGLTGAWQVSGRNNVTYPERVAMDVEYAQNWSFGKDLKILIKTVWVVLDGSGAL